MAKLKGSPHVRYAPLAAHALVGVALRMALKRSYTAGGWVTARCTSTGTRGALPCGRWQHTRCLLLLLA